MAVPASPSLFPRKLAIALLALLACSFAGNHIAARIAFDDGTGVLLAILCRSGITFLALASLVLWQRQALGLPSGTRRWQLLLGLLIATQSLCLYSAVARIPVALALLVGNTFPILLALLNWALNGVRPTWPTVARAIRTGPSGSASPSAPPAYSPVRCGSPTTSWPLCMARSAAC